jgi:FkbM family methyltransferase
MLTAAIGKIHAAKEIAFFVRHFVNWRGAFAAFRSRRPLPPLELRGRLTLHHGPGDDPIHLYREIFADRCYTSGSFYRPGLGDTVLDLGANIGFFAMHLQQLAPGIRVHCFEPASANRAMIERNVKANGCKSSVMVHPFAVAGGPGRLELRGAANSVHRSIFASRFVGEEVEVVDAVGLDQALDLCGNRPVDLLKIDVEGAEIEVVEGLPAGRWGQVRRVVVEYHDLFRPGCRERVSRVLAAAGFSLRVVTEGAEDLGLIFATK